MKNEISTVKKKLSEKMFKLKSRLNFNKREKEKSMNLEKFIKIKDKKETSIISKNLNKYNTTLRTYNIYMINSIVFDQKNHTVAVFKNYLLWDETSEFLKRYYHLKESISRIPKISEYYELYTLFAPIYFGLDGLLILIMNKWTSRKRKYLEYLEEQEDEIEQDKLKKKNWNFEPVIKSSLISVSKSQSLLSNYNVSKNTLELTKFNEESIISKNNKINMMKKNKMQDKSVSFSEIIDDLSSHYSIIMNTNNNTKKTINKEKQEKKPKKLSCTINNSLVKNPNSLNLTKNEIIENKKKMSANVSIKKRSIKRDVNSSNSINSNKLNFLISKSNETNKLVNLNQQATIINNYMKSTNYHHKKKLLINLYSSKKQSLEILNKETQNTNNNKENRNHQMIQKKIANKIISSKDDELKFYGLTSLMKSHKNYNASTITKEKKKKPTIKKLDLNKIESLQNVQNTINIINPLYGSLSLRKTLNNKQINLNLKSLTERNSNFNSYNNNPISNTENNTIHFDEPFLYRVTKLVKKKPMASTNANSISNNNQIYKNSVLRQFNSKKELEPKQINNDLYLRNKNSNSLQHLANTNEIQKERSKINLNLNLNFNFNINIPKNKQKIMTNNNNGLLTQRYPIVSKHGNTLKATISDKNKKNIKINRKNYKK